MIKYIVQGGTKLSGSVTISGAKNAAVAILPATLLVSGPCRIENVPDISDVRLLLEILRDMGAEIHRYGRNTLEIDCSRARNATAPIELVRRIRASYYLIGAELGRLSSGEQILDISAAGKYLAILTSSSLSIYDQALQEYDVSDNTAGAASVVMRADGSAILLANGHGTLYVP